MISDDEVQKSLDFLRDTADQSAKFKAERIYLEEYRKSLKALIMKQFTDLPVSAQEREAYASPRYQDHIKALQTAVFNDEKQKFLRVACEAKIEAWRSFSANHRSMKL
tara:strand:+ start:227 stop:550 length:324 start_codon:yes stop_codon:yes gene_type:complete